MKVQRVIARGNSQGINIPRTYLRALGWRQGTNLFLQIIDGALVVKRIPESTAGRAQAWLERNAHAEATGARKPSA